MKNRLKYGFFATVAVILISCTPSKNQEKKTNEPLALSNNILTEDTAVYKIERYKEFSPYFSKNNNLLDSTIYTASYPVFSTEIDTLIKPAIFVDGESTAEQVAASFLEGYNEYAEESIQSGNNDLHTWFMDQNCEVMLNIPRFITLKNKIASYSGGAHGIEVNLWFNYDISEKRLLKITDIIDDTEKLTKVTEHYFKEHENLNESDSYDDEYFFDSGRFILADNFGLTNEGIVFHYNPYEIKSYAHGPTTLTIPYKDIKNILTRTGETVLRNIAQK